MSLLLRVSYGSMSYRLLPGVSFGEDIRRIAVELIDGAVAESGPCPAPYPERVHSIRKRCKKLRALVRLVRPGLQDRYPLENEYFRDVAQVLAPLRDVHATVAAYDAVVDHFDGEVDSATFGSLRRQLVRRSRHRIGIEERLADVRGRMEAARERVAAWPLEDAATPEVWRAGFERTYRRARKALAAAYREPSADHFHEWRKNVKYHWYHVRLLSPLWDEAFDVRAETASALGELLGLHHDMAVLRDKLASPGAASGDGGSVDSFLALVDRHQAHVEAAARPLGMRLFAEKASRIGARCEKYWAAWQQQELQTPGAPVRLAAAASA
jgi:CHAD domain-containing protein